MYNNNHQYIYIYNTIYIYTVSTEAVIHISRGLIRDQQQVARQRPQLLQMWQGIPPALFLGTTTCLFWDFNYGTFSQALTHDAAHFHH